MTARGGLIFGKLLWANNRPITARPLLSFFLVTLIGTSFRGFLTPWRPPRLTEMFNKIEQQGELSLSDVYVIMGELISQRGV